MQCQPNYSPPANFALGQAATNCVPVSQVNQEQQQMMKELKTETDEQETRQK
jgi:hypothetical protein